MEPDLTHDRRLSRRTSANRPRRSRVSSRRLLALGVAITAAACGGNDPVAEPVRSVTVELEVDDSSDPYRYTVDGALDLRAGDEVTFVLDNTGTLIHDLQVIDEAGDVMAVASAAAPGSSTSLTVFFEEPGLYRLNCLVDDHLTTHGMQAIVQVNEAPEES